MIGIKPIKLFLGKQLEAWKKYPEIRKAFKDFPSGPAIFITGTHRSGTTWFAKMLAVQGLWYVHEPFNPNKMIWKEAFPYASPNDKREDIDNYLHQLLDGKYRRTSGIVGCEHPLMPLRLFRPPIQRVMIKDPLACLLVGYIAEHFDFQNIIIFRHPAGFVSSVTRLGWPIGNILKNFLARKQLMDEHLEPLRGLMTRHCDDDGIEAAAVLHGVMNLVLWKQAQVYHSIRYFLFEDLCTAPLDNFRDIFNELGLPYSGLTSQYHAGLCFGGAVDSKDYHAHCVSRNSSAMAESWKRQLKQGDVCTIRHIWEEFDIPLYENQDYWS